MEKWKGKSALVTGASSGIGKDICLQLVKYNLKVIGCGRNLDNLLTVKNELPENCNGEFIPFKCDVSKENEVKDMFKYVKVNFGNLSIIINNAGVAFESSILHGSTENMRKMFDINVLGLCMCTREAFSLMCENKKQNNHDVPGHIINICSVGGHIVIPRSSMHFYSATKFAVKAISEGIRQELSEIKSDIKMTEISPGLVETEFAFRAVGKEFADKIYRSVPEPLQASDVTEAVIMALSTPPRSCINEIIMRPTLQSH